MEVKKSSLIEEEPSYTLINDFIKKHGFTYKVETVLQEYKEKYGKYYVSYTMNHCLKNLKEPLDILVSKGF